MQDQRIIIIAGPNGAGKTTFAKEFLPNEANCPVFINADLIAAGLSPFNPEAAAVTAGRLMLGQIADHARRRQSFAFETTLSGRGYLNKISCWQKQGYRVKLIFLALESAQDAIERVAVRVRQGGHYIAPEIIKRRFDSGLYNFENLYCHQVDVWQRYNNNGEYPKLIDRGSNLK